MPQPLRRVLVALGVFLLQWLVLSRLSIYGAVPDALMLYVAWVGFRFGRLPGSLAGFGLGFLMDAVAGTWGIHMFSKTLVGFAVGLVPANERESQIIQPAQAFVSSTLIALLHNGVLVTFIVLQSGARTSALIWAVWLGGAVYTGFVGLLANLVSRR